MLRHSKSPMSKSLTSLGISFLSLICPCVVCLKEKYAKKNTQWSLLLLIHVQVQCDLAIIRNTCVNVCSLNCLNLFLKYKIGQICFVYVCVCVCVCFGSKCLTFLMLRDDFESLKCYLDAWLSSMFDCIYVYVFLFFEKQFLSNLDSFSIPLDSQAIYRAFRASFLDSHY